MRSRSWWGSQRGKPTSYDVSRLYEKEPLTHESFANPLFKERGIWPLDGRDIIEMLACQ